MCLQVRLCVSCGFVRVADDVTWPIATSKMPAGSHRVACSLAWVRMVSSEFLCPSYLSGS